MNKLQIDLLRAMRPAGDFGLGVDDLLADMRQGRHRELALPELEKALRDLADLSFAMAFISALKKKKWSITAIGARALQEAGL